MTKELLAKIKEMEEKADKNWLQAIRKTKTEEELIQTTARWGVVLSKAEAAEAHAILHAKTEELSDADLSGIAGGGYTIVK
jgi:hypothetical protein